MIGPIGCLWGRIPSREPPCRVWQVGVGVNPSLDAGGTLQLYARVVTTSSTFTPAPVAASPARAGQKLQQGW